MTILHLLQDILGNYTQQRDEFLFSCPFCHHAKKKLSINISTNKWKCWVCGSKGGHVLWLFKKLNVSQNILRQLKELIGEPDLKQYKSTTSEVQLQLPAEYKPLWKVDKSFPYKHAISYLKHRGITTHDILRYRIGYCTSGAYSNRIILPSYDGNNRLNYFTARMFYDGGIKYKNPPVSKNVIVFENMLDWSEPLVLCEGMFDAIALRRNAVPLLGKHIPKILLQKMLENKVQDVFIFLDEDAKLDAIKLEKQLLQYDFNVKVVDVSHQDAADLGFEQCWNSIESAHKTDLKDFIKQKLSVSL